MDAGNDDKLDEILDRVRRIETCLCALMEHVGLHPMTDRTFSGVAHKPSDESRVK